MVLQLISHLPTVCHTEIFPFPKPIRQKILKTATEEEENKRIPLGALVSSQAGPFAAAKPFKTHLCI